MARIVKAKTYPSYELSKDPTDPKKDVVTEVRGELEIRHVATLNYEQHLVNGIPVDPSTVEDVGDE